VYLINREVLQLSRGQRVGDEIANVRVPTNDVHLFVVQFPDDVFDPLAAQTDARSNRINLFVPCPDRQFRAKTRFAGDTFDFDGAIVDFRHFQLEQLEHEPGVGTGQNDFRTVRALLDGLDITATALADLAFLAGNALPIGQQGLVFAPVHDPTRAV
jgi:hypothetical protein